MNAPQDVLPPMHTNRPDASRSARWTSGLVLVLGFGFMASSLIDAFEPADGAASIAPLATAPLTSIDAIDPAGPAEAMEVDQAVRNWAWEVRGSQREAPATYDIRELGLER